MEGWVHDHFGMHARPGFQVACWGDRQQVARRKGCSQNCDPRGFGFAQWRQHTGRVAPNYERAGPRAAHPGLRSQVCGPKTSPLFLSCFFCTHEASVGTIFFPAVEGLSTPLPPCLTPACVHPHPWGNHILWNHSFYAALCPLCSSLPLARAQPPPLRGTAFSSGTQVDLNKRGGAGM